MLRNDRLTSNVSALTVKLSRTLDAGKYSCIAKSLLDGSVAEMTFNVAVMSRNFVFCKTLNYYVFSGSKLIQYGPSNQSMLIGSNIQMPCKIFDDLSKRGDLKVTWARNVYYFTYVKMWFTILLLILESRDSSWRRFISSHFDC